MQQAASGQRINTDSCIFGGIIGSSLSPSRILDVGAGTGVVSLMLALRFPKSRVVAVEPETEIAVIAEQNITLAQWQSRIEVLKLRAQDLDPTTHGKFDFVLCNPPYFQNSTPSPNRLRQVARHTSTLSPDELFYAFSRMMTPDGTAWMSCPNNTKSEWLNAGTSVGLYRTEETLLHDHPDATPHVAVLGWSFAKNSFQKSTNIFYRTHERGEQSPWMADFRKQWYPSRYTKSN